MEKIKHIIFLFFSLFIITNYAFSTTNGTPDEIKSLQNQGKIKEAKQLASTWLKETESKFGQEAIEVVIPLMVTSELEISIFEYKQAIIHLGRAIEIMNASSGWLYPDYAIALNYLIFCKISIGDSFANFPLLNEAEMIYFKTLTKDYPDYNLCNINRAILNRELGEFRKSEDYFKASLQFIEDHQNSFIKSKTGNTVSADWLNLQYAKLYIKWYKAEKSYPLLESIEQNLASRGDTNSPFYAAFLETLAQHYFISNEYKKAQEYYEKALAYRIEHLGNTHLSTLMTRLNLGEILSERGFMDEALENFQIVNKDVSKLKDNANIQSRLYLDIADIYLQKGYTKKTNQQLSLIKKETLTNRNLYFNYLRIQGELYFQEGDYINTELKLMELVSIVRQEKVFFTKYYSEAIVTLTELFNTLGRTQNGKDICEREIRFLEKRGMGRSEVYYNLQLTLLNTIISSDVSVDIEDMMHQIIEIEDFLMHNINAQHPLFIKSNILKGKLAFIKEEYNAGLSFLDLATVIADKYEIDEIQYQRITIIDEKAKIYIQKKEYDNALAEYRILKGKYSDNSVYKAEILGRIAYVKALKEDWPGAIELILRGVDLRIHQYDTQLNFTSEDEKINFIHHTSSVFEYFFSLMTKKEGHRNAAMIEKCYDLQVNYRKYFLKEAISRKKNMQNLGEYRNNMKFPNYVGNLDQQKSRLATANFFSIKDRYDLDIDTYMLTDRINNLEKSLSFVSKDENDSLKVSEYLSWKEVQKNIKENEVAVEIVKLKHINPNESFYVALAVSSDCKAPQFIPIGNASLMEGDLFKIYNKETKPNQRSLIYKNNDKPKVQSYDFYWEPIQEGIDKLMADKKVDKIYLSNDGIYNAINLNVLFNEKENKYLIEEQDIELVISTIDISHDQKMQNFNNNDICLIGNPTFEGVLNNYSSREAEENIEEKAKYTFYLEDLPGTKTELENTSSLFTTKGWNVKSYYKSHATEKNIKEFSTSPAIMHIATHGIYIDELINPILDNPLLKSGLFFSEIYTNKEKSLREIYESGNDGILTAYEVKGLDLSNTSLLILSACQTGVSDISDGDGISGLQYAFSIAGVESIIMSLWSVDDLATQKLMNEFYNQWFETKDINIAFRNAQLKLMEEYRKPYYWGAFVLVH